MSCKRRAFEPLPIDEGTFFTPDYLGTATLRMVMGDELCRHSLYRVTRF